MPSDADCVVPGDKYVYFGARNSAMGTSCLPWNVAVQRIAAVVGEDNEM